MRNRHKGFSLMEVILSMGLLAMAIFFLRSRGCFSSTESIVTIVGEAKQVGSYKFPDYVINTSAGSFVVYTSIEFAKWDGLKGKCVRIGYKETSQATAPVIKSGEVLPTDACASLSAK